jgi:hypothetical protein
LHPLLLIPFETGAIDDAYRSVSQCDDAAMRDEGKKIVEELARLKYEVQHDRAITYGLSTKMKKQPPPN